MSDDPLRSMIRPTFAQAVEEARDRNSFRDFMIGETRYRVFSDKRSTRVYKILPHERAERVAFPDAFSALMYFATLTDGGN